jgi:hypothetical protein
MTTTLFIINATVKLRINLITMAVYAFLNP